MGKVTPTPIPELATADPDPADPINYGVLGRLRWLWEKMTFRPGMNLLAEQTYQNAVAAETAVDMAEAIAHLTPAWPTLSGALNPPAVTPHNGSFWILLLPLPDVTASEPGVTSDWSLWERPNAGQIGYDNTLLQLLRNGVPPSNVQQVLEALAPRDNLLDNALFARYHRNAWLTVEPGTLAANAWLTDRWRAGPAGMTRADGTMAINRTVRILTGELRQTVRNPSRVLVGSRVTLAWAGNARGRINGGAWSASPLVWERPNSDPIVVSFYNDGSGGIWSGTLSSPRLYLGEVDHGPGRSLPPLEESLLMQRFFQRVAFDMQAYLPAGMTCRQTLGFAAMATAPAATVTANTVSVNVSSFVLSGMADQNLVLSMTAQSTEQTRRAGVIALDTGF